MAEYAIVAGIIAIVLAAMGTPFKRTIQKIVKSTADAIGFQSESEQAANPDDGFLNLVGAEVNAISSTTIDEDQGEYASNVAETTTIRSNSQSNMGFTEFGD